MDIGAIRGLAITTAFFRNDWCPGTSFSEVIDQDNSIEEIIKLATQFMNWTEVEFEEITIYDVAEAIWGMSAEELDEELAELKSE